MIVPIVVIIGLYFGIRKMKKIYASRVREEPRRTPTPTDEKVVLKVQENSPELNYKRILDKANGNFDGPDVFPKDYLCSIEQAVMADPTTVTSGKTPGESYRQIYERRTINEWFIKSNLDPITKLEVIRIEPNLELRAQIEQYFLDLKVEDLKGNAQLLDELNNFVNKRGKQVLLNDPSLRPLVQKFEEASAN